MMSMIIGAAAAVAPAAAQPLPPVAESSAAQKLFSTFGAVWTNLSGLEPGEVALNLGLSALVVAILCLAMWALRRLLHAGIGRLAATAGAETPSSGPPPHARTTWRLIQASAAITAGVVLLSIWGVDLIGWLTTTGAGATILRLLGVVLVAAILIEAAGLVVERMLSTITRRAHRGRRTAQMLTLTPLIRGCIQGFILVIAIMTVLSELGVKIGPLLASAGVVGIAVGFGAQTLVKDFLTGLFLVVEDIVAIGDAVRIGDNAGVVEAMTLRTIRLRAFDGTLHILPYSEAQVISNGSKTFSAYVIDIGIGYGSDIDAALEIMRQVGAELQADPTLGPKTLGPLEILGVERLAETAVMLKARFRTRPGEQGDVGREFNRRIKHAFDAGGVEIPYPTRQLVLEKIPSSEPADDGNGRDDPPAGEPR